MSCDPSQVEETVTTATETTAEVVAEVTPDPVPDTGFTPQLTPPPAEEEEEEDEVEEECVSALQLVGGQSLTHDNQSAIQSCDFMQPHLQHLFCKFKSEYLRMRSEHLLLASCIPMALMSEDTLCTPLTDVDETAAQCCM